MIGRGEAVRVTIEDASQPNGYAQHAGWLDRAWDGEGPVYLRQSAAHSRRVVFPAARILFVEEVAS